MKLTGTRATEQEIQAMLADHEREKRAEAVITKKQSPTTQCSACPNHVNASEYTERELLDDGWLLEPVVFCPRCGPDEGGE